LELPSAQPPSSSRQLDTWALWAHTESFCTLGCAAWWFGHAVCEF